MEQTPFDHFIKDKLVTEKFEYKDAYWLEAEKLLDRQEKKRRAAWWWWPLIAGFLAVASGSWWLLSYENDSLKATTKQTPDEVKIITREMRISTDNVNLLKTETGPGENKSIIYTNKSDISNNSETPAAFTNPSKGSQKESKTPQPGVQEPEATAIANKPDNQNVTQETVASKNETVKKDINITTEPEPIPTNTPISPDKPKPIAQSENKNDKTSTNKSIGIFAGGAYNFSVSSSSTLSPVFGFSFRRQLTNKWNFGFDISYFSSGKINYQRSNSITSYSLGMNVYTDSIKTTRLDYISIPITLSYALNENHSISGGIAPTMLVDCRNDVKRREIVNSEFRKEMVYHDHGLSTGLNAFDLQIQAGYQYKMNDKFALDLRYYMGLMKITDKSIYTSPTYFNLKNQGIMLRLHYYFINFN